MSHPRHIVALLVASVAIAAPPSAAFAQGAGDDQYSDPLAGQTSTAPTADDVAGVGSDSTGTQAPAPAPAPAQDNADDAASAPSVSTTPPAAVAQPQPAAAAGTALPNTGADPRVLALMGLALLFSGVGLRLRAR